MWMPYYNYETAGLWAFWPLLLSVAITAACVFAIVQETRAVATEKSGKNGLCLLYVFASFGLLWTLGVGYDIGSNYFRLKSIITHQQYEVAEGAIQDFRVHFHARTQTDIDSFTVNQVKFGIRDRDLSSDGGALVNGRQVRIYHHGPTILKLWVKQNGE